jgi:flavin reductase (DIM6/NTAB) family NADH-FMN oxidoreductase RutF
MLRNEASQISVFPLKLGSPDSQRISRSPLCVSAPPALIFFNHPLTGLRNIHTMELDLVGEHADRAYPLLASLVTPRPIAWVTTLGPDGAVNAAPFSFFNVLGAEPPIVGICPGDRDDGTPKDTARNIRLSHEFVVNLVDEDLAEAMNKTAASLPYGVSEIEHAGLHTAPSSLVKPPRIAEAPASLECQEWGTLQIGDNRLIIGLVKRLHVRDELIDPETFRIRSERFHVIGRMASPHWYTRTRDRFEMIRPA